MVDGYLSYIDLAPIFNGNVGQIYNANMKNEINQTMSYFNFFMKYIVERSANVGIQEIITKSIKSFLFKSTKTPIQKKPGQSEKNAQKNKAASNNLKNSI